MPRSRRLDARRWIAAPAIAVAMLGSPTVAVWSVVTRAAASEAPAAGMRPWAAIALATEQVDRGKAIFQNICAKCHGDQGQGNRGPRLIGTPNGLSGYGTAQGLFDFASRQMPFDQPGTLKPEEYWDVFAFILDANKLLPPDTILGPDNAADIRLSP